MIRGTKNEGISSQSKQRHSGGAINYSGTVGQSYEIVAAGADGSGTGDRSEAREEFTSHSGAVTSFPSNYFNGTFE